MHTSPSTHAAPGCHQVLGVRGRPAAAVLAVLGAPAVAGPAGHVGQQCWAPGLDLFNGPAQPVPGPSSRHVQRPPGGVVRIDATVKASSPHVLLQQSVFECFESSYRFVNDRNVFDHAVWHIVIVSQRLALKRSCFKNLDSRIREDGSGHILFGVWKYTYCPFRSFILANICIFPVFHYGN